MDDFENFEKIIKFLTVDKGIMQKTIAEKIGVNKVSFNQAISGARITKCGEYIALMKKHYEIELRGMGQDLPSIEKYTTQEQAWKLVLEKQDEILRGINLILENQKNMLNEK